MSARHAGPMPISLAQVLNKYWELANLEPEITKGSIAGQLKALDALCAELSGATREEERPRAVAGIYRAAWLAEPTVEPGREN